MLSKSYSLFFSLVQMGLFMRFISLLVFFAKTDILNIQKINFDVNAYVKMIRNMFTWRMDIHT